MPYGLYLSAEGAHAQSTRMDVIANNLANVDTVGFKRELALFQARYAEAVGQGLKPAGQGNLEDLGGGIMVRQTKTDFSPGPIKHTDGPTDVAIDGDGFFMVRKGDQDYLTRAGNFRLSPAGELRTQAGYDVLDASGEPITVTPGDTSWVERLAVVQPPSRDDLVKVGENLFRSLSEPEAVDPQMRVVAAGYLEGSTVAMTYEMTELIHAARALEANINMMKTQDEMLGGLVNRAMRV